MSPGCFASAAGMTGERTAVPGRPSLPPPQNPGQSLFTFAIFMGVKWHLIVVLVCISLMTVTLNTFLHAEPFIHLYVYSNVWSILKTELFLLNFNHCFCVLDTSPWLT